MYTAVYMGDTGRDYGAFIAGTFGTVEEAIKAVREGLKECFNHPIGGEVIDEATGKIIIVISPTGEIEEDRRENR
ncbi:MAG: hypothetical protein KM310_10610 [Clostridiales bacterium]|nr:hypothetical protein [Clostridiales bacterium]